MMQHVIFGLSVESIRTRINHSSFFSVQNSKNAFAVIFCSYQATTFCMKQNKGTKKQNTEKR